MASVVGVLRRDDDEPRCKYRNRKGYRCILCAAPIGHRHAYVEPCEAAHDLARSHRYWRTTHHDPDHVCYCGRKFTDADI